VDELGLDPHDRRILEIIADKFNHGPVGLSSLAAAMNEDKTIIEEVYEPYLISLGLLARTTQGRRITEAGFEHIKKHQGKK